MLQGSVGTQLTNCNITVVGGNYVSPGQSSSHIPITELVDKQTILRWLTHMDFRTVQDDTYRKHTPGTGRWLIESVAFTSVQRPV